MNSFLVIGSINIDVLSEYKTSSANFGDKIGETTFSIGGTAYNIAHNLSYLGASVSIISVCRYNSFISNSIIKRLNNNKIDHNHLIIDEQVKDSSFVCIMKDGKMESAVTTSVIEKVCFDYELIDNSIKPVEMVIIDCNLSTAQIREISRLCKKNNKLLAISGVSEPKVRRADSVYEDETGSPTIDFICMNSKEAESFFREKNFHEKEPQYLCSIAKSKNIIVSDGLNGYTIFNHNKKTFQAPLCEDVKSTSGAGDALMAAICFVYDGSNDFIEKNIRIIEETILMSLQIKFPTNDAEIRDNELEHIEQLKEKLKKTDIINTILTIIIAFSAIIGTYLSLK